MLTISPEARRRHDLAVSRGQDGYFDPLTNLFVLTSAYLSRRGFCCGNGCRHCPYGGERTPRAAVRESVSSPARAK
jgi:hypothetical protein